MSIRRRIRETGSSGITTTRDNFMEEEVAEGEEEVEDIEGEAKPEEEETVKKESDSENNEEITEQEASSPKPIVLNQTKGSGKSSKRSQYQSNNYRQRTYQSRGYRPSNLEADTASHHEKFRLHRYKRYSQNNNNNQYSTTYNNQDDYTYNQDANRNPDDEGTDSDFDQGTVDQMEEQRPIRTKHVPELMMTISAPVFDTKNYTVS